MLEELIWLVPVAVLAGGLWRPRGGILVLAAAVPLFGAPPGGPYLAALDLAALAAVAMAWRAEPAPRARLDLPVLAFVAISLASLVPAAYHPPSLRPGVVAGLLGVLPNVESWSALYTWRAAANLLLGWALYLAVRRAYGGRSRRSLGIALAVGLAVALLLGMAERLGLVDLWAYRPIAGAIFETRMHSLFFHSGWLAEYLVLAAPVAIGALLALGGRGRPAALVLAALTLVALPLTQQRGAWFAALAQLALLAALYGRVLRDRRQLRQLALILAAAVVVWLGLLALRPDLLAPVLRRATAATRLTGRLPVWRASVAMIQDRPVLGWGLGAFVPAHEALDLERFTRNYPYLTAHSQYLMIGAERGLLGLLAFGWLCWTLAVAVRHRLRDSDPAGAALGAGLAVGLAGAAVYGLAQYFFFLKSLEWLFWLLAGAAALPGPDRPFPRRYRLGTVLALALLVAWRAVGVESPGYAGDRSFGFHRSEGLKGQRFSWTEGRAARRLAWEGEELVLRLACGHPRVEERGPAEVTIRVDGRVVARAVAGREWTEHRIRLGPPTRESILLELEVWPTFRPFRDSLRYPELPRSGDIRLLGVAVAPIHWQAGPGTGARPGQGVGRSLP